MLRLARHSQIKEIVDRLGQATVAQLNAELLVSEATIRRDLDELDRLGVLRRTHGGAIRLVDDLEPPHLQRLGELSAEKDRIGRRAADLIAPGQTVFLGSGTTVEAMLPHLTEHKNLTVITNSLPVVNALAGRVVELIVIGGLLRSDELSMVGHISETAIRELRADMVFMGMRGIDVAQGFTSDYMPEALTDRAILEIAPRRIILADHSKFGRVSAVYLGPITAAEIIISDTRLDLATIAALQESGLEVLLA
ncbi:MAG: DeoR/GlpR transcriptional regulator [Candidatus Promineofilum sp.]|nr:DeoR/GlpR transcriptional regulator [Promineifilum sp.]